MPEDLSSRLMRVFIEEMDERINAFDRSLIALEEQPSDAQRAELVSSLFREAHSLKGAARSVEAAAIENVCHRLEDFLAEVREGRVHFDPSTIELLFETADALREAGSRLRGGEISSPRLAGLAQRLSVAARSAEEIEELEEQPAPSPQAPRPLPAVAARPNTVRVAVGKLDELLRQSGELLVANYHAQSRAAEATLLAETLRQLRADPVLRRTQGDQRLEQRLRELERGLDRLTAGLSRDRSALQHAAHRVDAEVRRIRTVPFAAACEGLDRTLRDTARSTGKTVQLRFAGADIEIDRSIAEGLRDPLVHLVRNAVDHGIEEPRRRREMGKPETGTVTIAASLRGAGVEITVSDDGAGLDLPALRRRALERQFDLRDDDDVATAVFLPGVSTAKTVTGVSGRGVGLDVVRTALDAIRGTIAVTSTAQKGTQFTLGLPLTLTTLRAVLCDLGGQIFALDAAMVHRLARFSADAVTTAAGRTVVQGHGAPIPLIPLQAVFDLPLETCGSDVVTAIVVGAGDRQVALRVDSLVDEREIVVRPPCSRLSGARAVAGTTMLPDGSLALVVRSSFVRDKALQLSRTWRAAAAPQMQAAPPRHILLVDDSVTTRTLERSILEAAGYEVMTASDGEEALKTLASGKIDLVVSDIDMPRMDGFALIQAMRASQQFQNLPVVLVTARENEGDKQRGLEVGADAYIFKSGFDQRALLETIEQLI